MANYGGQTLVFALPSPPDQLWAALTDPTALNQWFGETTSRAQVGLPFSVRPHASGLPAGTGEVTAVEPPRRLVVRWRADGRVLALTILVEPADEGSLLRVAHSDTEGVDDARSTALRLLYDGRLRAYLTGAPLPDSIADVVAPPVLPPPVPAPPAPSLPVRVPLDAAPPVGAAGCGAAGAATRG